MSSYNSLNYEKQGGSDWVVGGTLLPATETQAAKIAPLKTTYTTGELATEALIIAAMNSTNTAINAIITAITQGSGVGILSAS